MNPALRARALGGGLLVALACITLGSPRLAVAAPRIDVTATATIEIHSVEPLGAQGFRIIGQVHDATTGEPMPRLPLTGLIDDRAVRSETDDGGRFYIDLDTAAPPQRIELELASHRFVRAAPLELDRPAINRPSPLISIDAVLGRETFRVEIRRHVPSPEATDPGVVFDRPVDVVASQGASTLRLAPALVGAGVFELASLPSPGTWALTATYAGDDRLAPSSASTTLRLAAQGMITLELAAATVAVDDPVVARGSVSRADGGRMPPAAVVLMAGDQRLATTQTATDGSFELRLPANSLPVGRHGLSALLDTPIAGADIAPSPLRWLTVAATTPPSQLGAALGVALGALALVAVLWLQRRWRRQQGPRPPRVHRPGFAPARPTLAQRLLRPDQRRLGVVIYDAASQRPLAGTLTIAPAAPAAVVQIQASAAGDAHLELADGSYQLTVTCAGYRPVATSFSVPHRGQWTQRAVYLVSRRDVLFELYAEAIAPYVELSPNVASPASIFAHVRSKLALVPTNERDMYAPIKALTEQIEALYFGDGAIADDDMGAIERLTARVRRAGEAPPGVVTPTRRGLR